MHEVEPGPRRAGDPVAALRIDLIGEVAIGRIGGPAEVIGRRQDRIVLAALAWPTGGVRDGAAPAAPTDREALAEIVWRRTRPRSWETSLRGSVSRLRRALAAVGSDPGVIRTTPGGPSLRLPPGSSVDVADASRRLGRAEAALVDGGPAESVVESLAEAETVVRATTGLLLPDVSGAWVDARRHDIDRMRRRARLVVSGSALALGDHRRALDVALSVLADDPYSEAAHRTVMAAHAGLGDRVAALRAFERCRARLRDGLGIDPGRETEALYLDLLGDEPGAGAVGAAQLPFVGRRDEMAVLAKAWAGARDGSRRLVVVEGPSGVGKSRLVEEAAGLIGRSGGLVLRGRERAEDPTPLRSLASVIAAYAHLRGRGALDDVDRVDALSPLRMLAGLAPDDVPGRKGDPGGPGGSGDPILATSAGLGRLHLFQAVLRWLDAAAAVEPLVLVIEDAQWAAPTDLDLLGEALDDGPGRILVLVTCRPTGTLDPGLLRALARLAGHPRTGVIELAGLEADDVDELVERELDPGRVRDREAVVRAVLTRTGGHPLALGAVLRHLATSSPFEIDAETVVAETPNALADLVRFRRRSLGPDDALVSLAAAAGLRTSVTVLTDAGDAGLDVRTGLSRAAEVGLVELAGDTVSFSHELVRDAVLAGTPPDERAEHHTRLARTLAADPDPDPAPIAHHWTEVVHLGAEPDPEAAAWLRQAARLASAGLSFERAAEHLAIALELLDAPGPPDVAVERFEVLRELTEARRQLGDSGRPAGARPAVDVALGFDA